MPNDHRHQTALLLTHQSGCKHEIKATCKSLLQQRWIYGHSSKRRREDKSEREDELKSIEELFAA